MRKSILILSILISFLITMEIASARDRRPHYHGPSHRSGFYISPPVIRIAPPVYYRPYYPSYRAYPPDYYGYDRVWVPGYWEERWTPYGWEKVWIPGYWRHEY